MVFCRIASPVLSELCGIANDQMGSGRGPVSLLIGNLEKYFSAEKCAIAQLLKHGYVRGVLNMCLFNHFLLSFGYNKKLA